jgi:thioredoxin reductase (NADPH)
MLDCVVVGGGAAGLSAAIYLARYRRSFVLFDNDQSRANLIPATHNLAGFPDGIGGAELLRRMRRQAQRFGADLVSGTVESLSRQESALRIDTSRGSLMSRTVLLTTGVINLTPELPGLEKAVLSGVIRYCPICDGYDVQNKTVAVIGSTSHAAREALFLRTYTRHVTLLSLGDELRIAGNVATELAQANIATITDHPARVILDLDAARVFLQDGRVHTFDTCYVALGTRPRSGLAMAIGAVFNDQGCIEVDQHQRTSVDGLYAAGDVVAALDQISIAMGQAAIATTAIHNSLGPVWAQQEQGSLVQGELP